MSGDRESSAGFDPGAYLDSLEPMGWKLGLERMEALCDALDRPQDEFDTIHVVGTNGKSSVARMTAAVLEAQGHRAGCMVSPHLSSWSERILVSGDQLPSDLFAAAVRRTADAAAAVGHGLGPGDSITQFEISTAAGFLALAQAGVEVAAIEAGLGGRLDASNSINSSVTVLTSIGLDHTEYLGESELEIAAEKLAVLRHGTVLVIGLLSDEVRELALRTAQSKDCRVIEPGEELPPGVVPVSAALYQRWNLALAISAAGQYLAPEQIRPEALAAASSAAAVPGRLEKVSDQPPVFVDVAHNRPGAAALAACVPDLAAGSPVVGLIAILDDKDAGGIISELAPVLDCAVFTDLPADLLAGSARPGAHGRPPAELAEFAAQHGLASEVCPQPAGALARARELAGEMDGLVLAAGSHYLVGPAPKG